MKSKGLGAGKVGSPSGTVNPGSGTTGNAISQAPETSLKVFSSMAFMDFEIAPGGLTALKCYDLSVAYTIQKAVGLPNRFF